MSKKQRLISEIERINRYNVLEELMDERECEELEDLSLEDLKELREDVINLVDERVDEFEYMDEEDIEGYNDMIDKWNKD
ncbi:hypothetical protein [Clostridium paraputrificum]|uniref:hypothetical protein n=1 Tax=Clostridium paraputrificum TaxID=29363 RepID=UPI00374F6637